MAPSAVVTPYPWDRVERWTRTALRLVTDIRQRVGQSTALDGLARALGELVGLRCRILVDGVSTRPAPTDPTVALSRGDGVVAAVLPEPALAAAAVAQMLGRPAPFVDPRVSSDPAISGALSALVLEALRRTAAERDEDCAWRLHRDPLPDIDGVMAAVTVMLDDRIYAADVWIAPPLAPTRPRGRPSAPCTRQSSASPTALERIGDVPVGLPAVAAAATLPGDELRSLRVGDALMPGDAWTVLFAPAADGSLALAGRLRLMSPLGDRGVWAECCERGQVVLTDEPAVLDGEDRHDMTEQDSTIEDAVLDAPVVVRVEIAEVTLTARQWANLRPGDVVETSRPIAEPVVLRVGGRQVARGELVNVGGEVGVRVREILGSNEDP